MGERDTAEMRADADDHEPLVMTLLDARRVRLRIGQARDSDLLRFLDFLLGAMEDEDRLRSPEHLDDLPIGDRSEIDVDWCSRRDGRGVRIHLRDQRNQGGSSAYRADGASGDIKEVAARVPRRRHGRHVLGPLLRLAYSSARGLNPDRSPLAAGRPRLRQPRKGRTARRWRSIGTLAVIAQARKGPTNKAGHRFCARPGSKCYICAHSSRLNGGLIACAPAKIGRINRLYRPAWAEAWRSPVPPSGSPFTSRTSRRIPGRFSGSAPASALRFISSSLPASR